MHEHFMVPIYPAPVARMTLHREPSTPAGTFGVAIVTPVSGAPLTLQTLEPVAPIRAGVYDTTAYASPKRDGQAVPLLADVPGHTFVEIHPLNLVSETTNCIGVGWMRAHIFDKTGTVNRGLGIAGSDDAFAELMAATGGALRLTIVDPIAAAGAVASAFYAAHQAGTFYAVQRPASVASAPAGFYGPSAAAAAPGGFYGASAAPSAADTASGFHANVLAVGRLLHLVK